MTVTKVGPPDKSDFPRKRGLVMRFLRWLERHSMIGLLLRGLHVGGSRRMVDATFMQDEPEQRPHEGIPEADLTEAQRREAVERMTRGY